MHLKYVIHISDIAEECPLGFVPVLTTPCGKKISQTTAIIRYVASELNLFGKDNLERAVIDSTIVSNKELGDIGVEIMFKLDDEEKIVRQSFYF